MSKNTLIKAVLEQSRGWLYLIVALLLFCVILFVYQTQFVSAESDRLQQQRDKYQRQLSSRQEKLAESGVPVSAVEQMEKDLLAFSALIPDKKNFADFIGELFLWANQSQLEIKQVNYQPEIDEETEYLNYGLSFSVQGDYAQLKKFIHLLEASKRILIIDKIAMAGRRTDDNSTSVNLQINLTTFFQEARDE